MLKRIPDVSTLLRSAPIEWPELIRRRLGYSNRPPLEHFTSERPCVFTLSTGRTGTQTLASLGGLTDSVVAVHEPQPTLFGLSRKSYEHRADTSALELLTEAVRACRTDALLAALARGYGYLETSPQGTFLAPALLQTVPEVKFIHLVRHPAPVVRSGMRRGWYAGHSMDHSRIVAGRDPLQPIDWKRASTFEKNCWLWAETNLWILSFLNGVERSRVLRLRTEDVVCGDPSTLESFYEFVGAPTPTRAETTALLGKRMNAQHSGAFPTLDEWTVELRTGLQRYAGLAAETLGYTLD